MSSRKEGLQAVLLILGTAVLSHILCIYLYPYGVLISRYLLGKERVHENEVYHEKPVDAQFRKVVMASPDILYSACAFKLHKHDLLLEAEVPPFTYWSASFYADNTDNFFTLNDRMVQGKISLILTARGKEEEDSRRSQRVIHAPSSRGLVIFRMFIPSRSLLPELERYQKTIRCQPLEP